MMMSQAFPVSRLGASEAHLGVSSLEFDGRSFDWSAVAFERSHPMPIEQCLCCFSVLVLLSIPYVFIGAAVSLWLR
jgi:hypothetical protein